MTDEQTNGAATPGSDHAASGGDPAAAGGKAQYARAEFQNLQEDARGGGVAGSLNMILDIPVTLTVEIGRTKIDIRDLLRLNQGSVVELERIAGEPMEVFVNGTLIAHGEVVVMNEKFGIRLTDVISAEDRVRQLG